jgi:hypothetical protein
MGVSAGLKKLRGHLWTFNRLFNFTIRANGNLKFVFIRQKVKDYTIIIKLMYGGEGEGGLPSYGSFR